MILKYQGDAHFLKQNLSEKVNAKGSEKIEVITTNLAQILNNFFKKCYYTDLNDKRKTKNRHYILEDWGMRVEWVGMRNEG